MNRDCFFDSPAVYNTYNELLSFSSLIDENISHWRYVINSLKVYGTKHCTSIEEGELIYTFEKEQVSFRRRKFTDNTPGTLPNV